MEMLHQLRPYSEQVYSAYKARGYLKGSYLWERHEKRALQDPLSFRSATQVHGSGFDSLRDLKHALELQLNSSDDNPAVILGAKPSANAGSQELGYYVLNGEVTGAVVPTANFEPLAWVLEFEKLSIALGHVSLNSVSRMLHLVDPHMTGLSRFLAPDEKSISYGTIQKTFSALNSEIQALVLPASLDYIAVAGGIEDHATNAPLIIRRVLQILDNLFYLAAIELMHAAQAVDLRKKFEPSLMIGESTGTLLREFRKSVPFLDEDRVLSHDVEAAYRFLKASKTIQPSASLDSGSSINKHFTAGL